MHYRGRYYHFTYLPKNKSKTMVDLVNDDAAIERKKKVQRNKLDEQLRREMRYADVHTKDS